MKGLILWLSLVVLAIAILSALWFLPGRGVKTETVKSIQLMQNIFIDLDLLQEADNSRLSQSVRSETNALDLNRTVAAFLKTNVDPYITNSAKLVSNDGLFRDSWGNLIWFATTNSTTYSRINPQLKEGKATPFVIWSSGPNQTNEFGFGDDLFLHR